MSSSGISEGKETIRFSRRERPRLKPVAQPGLFDGRSPGGFTDGRRYALDAASWVDHFPGWLPQPDALFSALADHATREQQSHWMFTHTVTEPRLTAEFLTFEQIPVPEIGRIAERLSQHYGVRYDSAWMNLYRDHDDGTSWHADRPAHRRPTAIVPVLSLAFLASPGAAYITGATLDVDGGINA